MGKIYLVQVKSDSIVNEKKGALLIPMEFDYDEIKGVAERTIHDALIRDAMKLYPQYTELDHHPIFSIRTMSRREYNEWIKTGVLKQKSYSRSVNPNEVMGN